LSVSALLSTLYSYKGKHRYGFSKRKGLSWCPVTFLIMFSQAHIIHYKEKSKKKGKDVFDCVMVAMSINDKAAELVQESDPKLLRKLLLEQ
jgi:hypothetical protein